MTAVVWRPDEAMLRDSNVARFMAAERIAEFPALVRRSIDEPEWFWDAVVGFLGLRFDAPYTAVLDTSAGIEWAKWFVGGQCNVASMCLDALGADARRDHLGRRGGRDSRSQRGRAARPDRSHRLRSGGARSARGRCRRACSCRWCPRRSPRCSRSRRSARSSCRSSPATARRPSRSVSTTRTRSRS